MYAGVEVENATAFGSSNRFSRKLSNLGSKFARGAGSDALMIVAQALAAEPNRGDLYPERGIEELEREYQKNPPVQVQDERDTDKMLATLERRARERREREAKVKK